MIKKITSPFFVVVFISAVLLLCIALNVSPYLRGPGPYYPDWRWTYEFSNTLKRIWLPLFVILGILYCANITEKKDFSLSKKRLVILFSMILLLGFLLQLSILFYSRAGIFVLIHRIINPSISGYFTVSQGIVSVPDFLHKFNTNTANYPMYAKFHPPAAILFFWVITEILKPLSPFLPSLSHSNPGHADVLMAWSHLTNYQKISAVASGFIVTFLANAAIIPLYYCGKILYGARTAVRCMFLFLFIPSILLFTPLNDVFLPVLTLCFFYTYLLGIKKQNYLIMCLSGFLFSLSVAFSLTFLPMLLFLLLIGFGMYIQQKKHMNMKTAAGLFSTFLIGAIILPLGIYFAFGLNSVIMTQKLLVYHENAQGGRKYTTWVFYNLYDFFLFLGIPLGLLFIHRVHDSCKAVMNKKFTIKKADSVFICLTIFLLFVDVSGTVMGETARIWIPYMPLFVLVLANYISTGFIFSRQQFLILLSFLALQVLVFQTVLVTLW